MKPLHRWTIGCLALLCVESSARAQYGVAQPYRYTYPAVGYGSSPYQGNPYYRPGAVPYRPVYSTPYTAAYRGAYPAPYTAYRAPTYGATGYPAVQAPQGAMAYAPRANYPSYYSHRAAYGNPAYLPAPGATPANTHTSKYGYGAYAYGYPPTAYMYPPVPVVAPRACPPPPPVEEIPEPVKFHRECQEKMWVNGGFLFGWMKQGELPGPLLTIGSVTNQFQGALGQTGTAIIFNDSLEYPTSMGVHAEAGMFLDHDNRYSIEARGFYLFENSTRFSAGSDGSGSPLVARPVFNTDEDREGSFVVSFPGLLTGTSVIESNSQLFGGEVNGRYHCYLGKRWHTDVLGGFRYLNLQEDLKIADRLDSLVPNVLTFLGQPLDVPSTIFETDRFATGNQFFGLQFGGRAKYEHDWFSLSAYAKAAVGVTDQKVRIDGSTVAISPVGTQIAPGGILALPTNMGDRQRTVFSVVPEIGMNLSLDVHKNIRLTSGYSFMAWTGVARPGAQVSRRGSPGLAPSDQAFGTTGVSAEPSFVFNDEVFWIHYITLGVEFHY